MTVAGGVRTRPLVPRTSVLASPLQDLQMTVIGGVRTRLLVPGTAVLASPLQDFQMTVLGGVRTRLLVPGTAVLASPLQDLQMTVLGGVHTRPCIPGTAVLASPLQGHQVAVAGCLIARSHAGRVSRKTEVWSHFPRAFGKVWHKIHEQHLSTTRIGPVFPSPVMERFYAQSFGSGQHGQTTSVSSSSSSARWA